MGQFKDKMKALKGPKKNRALLFRNFSPVEIGLLIRTLLKIENIRKDLTLPKSTTVEPPLGPEEMSDLEGCPVYWGFTHKAILYRILYCLTVSTRTWYTSTNRAHQ